MAVVMMKSREQRQAMIYAISPIAYIPFAHWVSTTRVGTDFLIHLEIIYLFTLAVSVFAVPVLLIQLCEPKTRPQAKTYLLFATLFIPCCIGGLILGDRVRMARMRSFTVRSQPLIAAIEAYVSDHSNPPSTLQDLVPEYLDEIPWTGMMAYPEYRYITDVDSLQWYEDNPWALVVDTPSGGINFDSMMYLPLQNYPKQNEDGWLEPIGDWAYVHE